MAINEGIFSIRLVIADFYMDKPLPGLDPVYSEFRGKEIKKVPIIRVFGSNAQGQKTCMHVHGVFPYFYVPYDQKNFESANKAIYQMAINLDKAINISLSQGSSTVQHVFKVQLVKGIPFYGYHRSDHQYLKIYMFNPRFVRRAANLLQSGAIMNKNFHPHESHVPYVLQFMIDYNLYGMSFLHVPMEIVKFRRSDSSAEIPFKHIQESQVLDCNVATKLSCSTLEVDVGSSFILNRFQLIAKTSATHTNPGIESIWHDEKLRRQKLAQSVQDDEEKIKIPPLEVPSTQERPNVYPTESEIFYRTALVSKLVALETSLTENSQISDETVNCTFQSSMTNATNVALNSNVTAVNRQQKRTFNLRKILQNSVYPEECTPNENLVNASVVENHLSNKSAFQQNLEMAACSEEVEVSPEDESVFMDDTIIDEQLVLNLTQTQQQLHVPLDATLREEDLELLDVLQQLEEDNNGDKIDLDSSLAPLSQEHNNYALSPTLLDKETAESALQQQTSDNENVDDDDNIHDFSIALENLDDLILKITQSQINHHETSNNPPQTDGADELLKTPTKATSKSSAVAKTPPRTPTTPNQRRLTLGSPSRSPRTPKSGYKYKPLPLIITNRSTGKKTASGPCKDATTPSKDTITERGNSLPTVSLRKKLALTELRRKSISIETKAREDANNLVQNSNVGPRRSSRVKDLDKTHVTCNLTPRRTNEKLLKVYNVNNRNVNDFDSDFLKEKSICKSISTEFTKQKKNSNHYNREDVTSSKPISKQNDNTGTIEKVQHHFNHNPNDVANTENSGFNLPLDAEDDNNEIVDSDNESFIQLRKTPNLKRLRRSFLSKRSSKRRKCDINDVDVVNSSKFDSSTKLVHSTNFENTKKHFEISENQQISPGNKTVKDSSLNAKTCASDTDKLLNTNAIRKPEIFSDQSKKRLNNHLKADIEKAAGENPKPVETEKSEDNQSPSNKGQNVLRNNKILVKNYQNVEESNIPKQIDHKTDVKKPSSDTINIKNMLEYNNEQPISNVETILRKSKRIGAKDHKDDISTTSKESLCKTKDTKGRSINVEISVEANNEDENALKSSLSFKRTAVSPDASKSIFPETKGSSKFDKHQEGARKIIRNIRNCRVRLKNMAKENFNKLGKLGIMEILPESEGYSNKPLPQKVHNIKGNEMNKKNDDETRIIEILSEESEKIQHGLSLETCANNSDRENGLPSSNDSNPSQMALSIGDSNKLLHVHNTENLLKSLLNLAGSETIESLLNSAESNVKPLPASQTSSKNLFTDSPGIPHSSDEEIAETPPYNDIADANVSSLKHISNLHSPLLFSQNSSPNIIPHNKEILTTKTSSISNSKEPVTFISLSTGSEANVMHGSPTSSDTAVVLAPLDLPPTREEVEKGCIKLKLPEYEFQQPYYSNPDDITKQKEVGFTILQISGNKLSNLEEFQSILGNDLKGLCAWRRNQLLRLGGPAVLNKYRNNQRIREYFADHKTVAMTPQMIAPTRQEVKIWLKARELLKNNGDNEEAKKETFDRLAEEDSPIKVRRQKVTLMLNNEDDDSGDDCNNSLDCSSRSLTLTPLTPTTPIAKDVHKQKINKSFTPVTTKLEKIPLERLNFLRRRNNRRILRRIPLIQKFKEVVEEDKSSATVQKSQESDVISASEESAAPNSQTSETSSVSSQTALAEMNRSSFMKQIQQHDVTIGCSNNNNSTLNNTFGFKVALENLQQAKADIEFNFLTIITLEVFVGTRDDLFPDPRVDEIRCLFYAIENSIPNDHIDNDKKLPRKSCGYIMVHDSRDAVAKEGYIHGIDHDIQVTIVNSEIEALEALLGLCSHWDPDIYAGYEIEMSSWGFVIERAKYLCLNIAPLLSRVPTQKMRDFVDEDREQFTDLDVEMKLCGRILLDVWRLMRSEIALTSYTFENVMYHIMHKRCPWHSYRTLTDWFSSPSSRWIVIEYYLERVRGTLGLLDQLDLIGRTSEMAKLIGIQFYEVLSRGSQFRVESMMLRIAKPKNLVPLSPSVQQRAHMRAPEYLPLILEPQSRFYADPLIVLDFQSLYPSMIIAYNYCYSTCLGRVEHLGQSTPFEFGASQLRVSPSMLRKLVDRDLITISPCGVVFVKSSVREGILPRLLTEILDTRQMVKQSMKVHKSNSALQRILHSRQLGLKLMANTTYGYTAANFSGRMPAVEVGDSVVAKGRETLERAIKIVEANEKWNVKVVYGDTDSMFVLVPGRKREEAFRIGEEIAEAVSKQNPQPVKLKLEKVYQPCILQTKKRYVGYMYETPDQKEPVYEAKGIETVRRDGCPMVAKMLEKVLRILFESADVSQVKQYVCRHFTKLLSGRANLQDLIFAKEFRGMNGYKPNACVPALELTRKWIQTDPRRIPRRGERVPFIITNGPPGVPLIRLIRHPHEVLADEGLKINAIYYITKAIIPPLNRCLLLIGADVNEWFASLPRKVLMTPALSIANEVIACPNNKSKKSTISQFFSTTNCITDCGRHTKQGICDVCNRNPSRSMITLQMKISKIERAYLSTQQICQSCCGRVGDLKCDSLDCPVLYVLEVKRRDLQQIGHFRNLLEEKF